MIPGHAVVWTGELWECADCDFETDVDDAARQHSMSSTDQLFERLGVSDG